MVSSGDRVHLHHHSPSNSGFHIACEKAVLGLVHVYSHLGKYGALKSLLNPVLGTFLARQVEEAERQYGFAA